MRGDVMLAGGLELVTNGWSETNWSQTIWAPFHPAAEGVLTRSRRSRRMGRRSIGRALAAGGVTLLLLVSCAGPDTSPEFPAAPSPTASRFTVTSPGALPFD